MKLPPLPSWAPWAALGAGLAALVAYAVKPPDGSSGGGGGFWGPPDPFNGVPLDDYAPFETEDTCDPTPKPGMLAFRRWILDKFGEKPGSPQNIVRACDVGGNSAHKSGRGWDLMVNSIDHGQSVVDYLLAPDPVTGEPHALARRAGVRYLIWNRQMWRSYAYEGNPSGTWVPYTKGEAASPHVDHIHFSLSWPGANGETSLYPWLASQEPIA